MKLNKALSLRIKELLSERNMSQYRLEQLSGITHNTMLCLMNERYKSCNLQTIMKIIKALNISTKDFFDCEYFDFKQLIFD